MAVNDATLVASINHLTDTLTQVAKSGSLGAASGLRMGRGVVGPGMNVAESAKREAEQIALRKATVDASSALKALRSTMSNAPSAFDKTLTHQAKITEALMNGAIDRLSYDELTKLPEAFEKEINKSSKETVKRLSGQYKTLDDILKIPLKAQKLEQADTLTRLDEIRKAYKQDKHLTEDLNNELKEFGITVEELGENNEEVIEKTKEALEVLSEASATTGHSVRKILGRVAQVGAALIASVSPFIDLGRKTAELGGDFDTVSHILMGMSPEELLHLQRDYRQTILSSGMTMDEFNSTVKKGASELVGYTGSLRESIRVNAANLDNARFLGVAQQDQTVFMGKQTDMFKFLNRIIGTTAEQFTELNKRLIDDEGVRQNLYRLNVNQRAAYIEDLQLTRQRLIQGGMTLEQAQKMTEVFAQIGAKSPKERLKEAAKLQAVAGALGMGGIGAEAAALIRGGMRGRGEKERFAELSKSLSSGMSGMMASGLAGEMQAFALQEATGLQDYFSGPFADQELQRTKALTDEAVKTRMQVKSIDDNLRKMIVTADILTAAGQNPLFKSVAGIATGVEGIYNLMKSGAIGKVGMTMAGAGARAAGALGTAAMWGGGALASGAAGYAAGTVVYNLPGVAEALGDFVDAEMQIGDKLQDYWNDFFGAEPKTIDEKLARLADQTDRSTETLAANLKYLTTKGIEINTDLLDKMTVMARNGSDMSDILTKMAQDADKWGKKTSDAVEKGNDDRKQLSEENKKDRDKQTRIVWARAAGR